MFKSIKSWWRWRNTPRDEMVEIHDLIVLAARRCAYDLNHAADEIGKSAYGIDYHQRSQNWLDIFNPADGGKNYRHRLHREIACLEHENEKLKTLLNDNGIEYEDKNSMPF